jgi:hypothetical protein
LAELRVGWSYHRGYVGPNRRSERFQVRFIERRRETETETRASLGESLRQIAQRGLRWVDHLNYFGPDRRGGAFSIFFFERRKESAAGTPPSLHAALRQLRVRVLEADNANVRHSLRERFTATALLADAQGRTDIGDILTALAWRLEAGESGLSALLQSELLRAAAMLSDPAGS